MEIPEVCRESQRRAMDRLSMQAWGYHAKKNGDEKFGEISVSPEEMLLQDARATGTASHAIGFISNLADRYSPYYDEKRLNRFLIQLGRALETKDRRQAQPDWANIDTRLTLIVHGWCNRTRVNGVPWPPLCLLTFPALWKLLEKTLPDWNTAEKDVRTFERRIKRLGLKSIPKRRLKNVKMEYDELGKPRLVRFA